MQKIEKAGCCFFIFLLLFSVKNTILFAKTNVHMSPKNWLAFRCTEMIKKIFEKTVSPSEIVIQNTPSHFIGEYSIVCFSLSRQIKKSPHQIAEQIENELSKEEDIASVETVKGFVNVCFSDVFWKNIYEEHIEKETFLTVQNIGENEVALVEFSSPNTNKPLHLGHIRNNLLGMSVSRVLETLRYEVKRIQIINDRGIHICKSMIAWKRYGEGKTPTSKNKKGDHFVGDYYVKYNDAFLEEVSILEKEGYSRKDAEENAPIFKEAQTLLLDWEKGETEVIELWKKMNEWVYKGFGETYKKLGVSFHKNYYESETYLLGKDIVHQGVEKKVFFTEKDGSIWIDLEAENLDKKLLQRSNGTSVYMTQDLGTAVQRKKDFDFKKMIYVVGNEQDYHFSVLFSTLKKMGFAWAENCFHLSYGMIELPSGKMKSREGTVVDADDLIQEMEKNAFETFEALKKENSFSDDERKEITRKIALAALKFFILKVNPKKKMVFNPEESIDLQGDTGPFVQYTYVRIHSLLKQYPIEKSTSTLSKNISIHKKERTLMQLMFEYETVLIEAAKEYNPATIANYVFEIAKNFNSYYQEVPIGKEENEIVKNFRIHLIQKISLLIEKCGFLLGMEFPKKM